MTSSNFNEHIQASGEVNHVLRGTLHVEHLGTVPYGKALEMQKHKHQNVSDGLQSDTLFLLEHPPVITTGRNSGAHHLLASKELLDSQNIEVFETGRGGDITYHGPGQLVGYPIIQLTPSERDIKKYVYNLEEVLIRTVRDYDIEARRIPKLRGIWVGNNKIAAIGVRISRWTTMHGFALNINVDLAPFGLMVPCGIQDKGVTSMAKLLNKNLDITEVATSLSKHAARILNRSIVCETSFA